MTVAANHTQPCLSRLDTVASLSLAALMNPPPRHRASYFADALGVSVYTDADVCPQDNVDDGGGVDADDDGGGGVDADDGGGGGGGGGSVSTDDDET